MDALRSFEEALASPCRCKICGREYYPQRGDEPCKHEDKPADDEPATEEEAT